MVGHGREFDRSSVYRIHIRGVPKERWLDWFEGFSLTPLPNDDCLLVGPVADQAALHGLLASLRSLGLPLVSVCRVEADDPPPAEQAPPQRRCG